jgi:hypothetical protein
MDGRSDGAFAGSRVDLSHILYDGPQVIPKSLMFVEVVLIELDQADRGRN